MRAHRIAIALLTVVIGATSCGRKAEVVPGKQTHCPVMTDREIDLNLYVDAEGRRIYVCCPGCIAPVKADPGKYISELEAQGVILEETPE